MDASELALKVLAFVLTYAIHSTLLLGVACLVAPRIRRSLALKERVWKAALIGGLCTAFVQVAASHRTPFFHWTLRPETEIAAETPRSFETSPVAEDRPVWTATEVAELLIGSSERMVRDSLGAVSAATLSLANAPQPDLACADETAEERDNVAACVDELPAPIADTRTSLPRLRPSFESPVSTNVASVAVSSAPSLWRRWTERGVVMWAGFAALISTLFAGMWWRLTRRLRDRYELTDGDMRATLDRLLPSAFPRGRTVRLYVAPELSTPVSLGVMRLAICVPPRALDELSAEEQETMLAHELAHLMRRDPLWLSIAWFVERVFFFQPLNRVARAEMHDVAEMMCDDWAARRTGNRLALASCLARIAGWIIGPERALPATSMADAHGRCRLAQRIERLLEDEGRSAEERVRRWVAPVAAGALASWVLVAPGVSAVSDSLLQLRDVQTPALFEDSAVSSPAPVPEESDVPETAVNPAVQAQAVPLSSALTIPVEVATDSTAPSSPASSLGESLALLDESIDLLRAEFALLRTELEELEFGDALAPTLAALESRAAKLERRRDQLRALAQVLEQPPKKPAHPSSALSSTEVP